jgi:hypothetical protein
MIALGKKHAVKPLELRVGQGFDDEGNTSSRERPAIAGKVRGAVQRRRATAARAEIKEVDDQFIGPTAFAGDWRPKSRRRRATIALVLAIGASLTVGAVFWSCRASRGASEEAPGTSQNRLPLGG